MSNKHKLMSYAFRALAFVFLAFAIVSLFVFPNSNELRMIAMVLLMATPFLIKMSRDYRRKSLGQDAPISTNSATRKGPSKRLVFLGIALLLATGVSWILLGKDFIDGGNEVWPLYLFVFVGFVCGVVWSGIVALWLGKFTS